MPNPYRQQHPKGRLVRPFVFACVVVGLLGCTAMAAQESPTTDASTQAEASAPAGRLRPSPSLACDRNNLTSYSGVVSGYRVDPDNTHFEISTDEDTVEALAVDHDGQADGRAHYLLWGAPFTAADFAQIEKSPGVLIDGIRVVAWVCEDGKTPPVIDWQPKRD
jgi:hypothetical protein